MPEVDARIQAARGRNHLLASLDAADWHTLCPHLEPARLQLREHVYESGDPIRKVVFVLSGLISVIAISREGASVEVGPVGCDGMVGLPVFLDGETDPLEAFAQVAPADVVRLPSPVFRKLADELPSLQRVMRRYVQWTYFSMAQWVLCARLHPVDERLTRWLLMAADRVGAEHFPLTHEFIAQMLGVRRATVTVTLGTLRKAGLVGYTRGVVTIHDRTGLADASCECWRVTNDEYWRLFGRAPERSRPFEE